MGMEHFINNGEDDSGPIPERGHNGSASVGIGRFSGEATQELRSENGDLGRSP